MFEIIPFKECRTQIRIGLALRQSGQVQESASAFYRAIQLDPSYALTYANLGAALLEGNNLKQSREYLARAIVIDPKLGMAHYNLGFNSVAF